MKYYVDNKKKNVNAEISVIINCDFDNLERAKDIEESGLCIISNKEYKKGLFISILILIPNSIPIQAFGNVVWKEKVRENIYNTGVKFWYMTKECKEILINYIKV